MKKSIAEKFKDFRIRHDLSLKFIKELAKEYASTDTERSRSFFMDKYDISESVFYRARDFAVVCALVNPTVAGLIFQKAAANSRIHGSAKGSILHSEWLIKQREDFINSFSQADLEDICRKYADGLKLSVIANQYETGEYGVQLLLKKAILSGFADATTYQRIDERLNKKGRSILEIYPK